MSHYSSAGSGSNNSDTLLKLYKYQLYCCVVLGVLKVNIAHDYQYGRNDSNTLADHLGKFLAGVTVGFIAGAVPPFTWSIIFGSRNSNQRY